MVRQAHTYLAGAVSGTALIGAAVVAFVLLVSLQALRDWPLAGIGGGSDSSAVSSGQPAAGAGGASAAATTRAKAGVSSPRSGVNRDARQHSASAGESKQQVGAPTSAAPGSPAAEAPASSPTNGGAANPTTQSTSSSSAGGGGTGGGGGRSPASPPGTGGAGGGGSAPSTSGAVTGAVNNTVSGVDQTLGGTLGETGVTKATEEVVNGAAGPESTVGETVDKVVETVNGLLGGKR